MTAERAARHLTLFTDGDDAFREIWGAIDAARKRVWLEVYIFERDEIGRRTLEAMTRAARRGCDVILQCDWFGSPDLSGRFSAEYRSAGGQVVTFNPLWPWNKRGRRAGSMLHRDHRKILLIDDNLAYCGGMNVGCRYAGKELGENLFRDVLLRLEGAAAVELGQIFLESLREASDLQRDLARPEEVYRTSDPMAPSESVRVLGLNCRQGRGDLSRAVCQAVDDARTECLVTAAYFVPPSWLVDAMIRAIRRGVSLRLITAGRSDVPLARVGGRHIYGKLLQEGARVWELRDSILHAKWLTVDGSFSLVGSYNFDAWSTRHNLEVAITTRSTRLAAELERNFRTNLARSREVILERWQRRALHKRSLEWLVYNLAT